MVEFITSFAVKCLSLELGGAVLFCVLLRLPKLYRQRRLRRLSLADQLTTVTAELVKDFSVVPSVLLKCLTPWRLCGDLFLAAECTSLNEQRAVLKADTIRAVEDYLTIAFSLILLATLWRAPELLEIVFAHMQQRYRSERPTCSLFRKVFRQFCQLMMDLGILVLTVLTYLMIIEAWAFTKRLRSFYYMHRQSGQIQVVAFYNKYFKRKSQRPEEKKASLDSLSRNVFAYMCEFLDIQTLGTLSCVNSKMNAYLNFPPIWKAEYERNWKAAMGGYSELVWEDDFKRLSIEGFQKYRRQRANEVLDEQQRDYRIGLRGIVVEEFILSVLHFPQLFMLPMKAFVWAFPSRRLADVFNGNDVHCRWLNVRGINAFHGELQREFKQGPGVLNDFYSIQLESVYIFLASILVAAKKLVAWTLRMNSWVLTRVLLVRSPAPQPITWKRRVFAILVSLGQLAYVSSQALCAFCLILVAVYSNYTWLEYTLVGSLLGPAYLNLVLYFVFIVALQAHCFEYQSLQSFYPLLSLRLIVRVLRPFGILNLKQALWIVFLVTFAYWREWDLQVVLTLIGSALVLRRVLPRPRF